MTTFSSLHPLKYIAEALSQMASTLRDFEMQESAQLLDKAKSDIDRKLGEKPKKGNGHKQAN
jgi:hypothetical protein